MASAEDLQAYGKSTNTKKLFQSKEAKETRTKLKQQMQDRQRDRNSETTTPPESPRTPASASASQIDLAADSRRAKNVTTSSTNASKKPLESAAVETKPKNDKKPKDSSQQSVNSTPKQKQVSNSVTLTIRLPDGTQLRNTFNTTSDTIGTVRDFIREQVVINTDFSLVLAYPKREFSDNNQTLQQCNLTLNESLLVILKAPVASNQNNNSAGSSWIMSIIIAILHALTLGFFKTSTHNATEEANATQQASSSQASSNNSRSAPQSNNNNNDDTVISQADRNTQHSRNVKKRGNIAGFGDQSDADKKDDDKKTLSNGNGTQYKQ